MLETGSKVKIETSLDAPLAPRLDQVSRGMQWLMTVPQALPPWYLLYPSRRCGLLESRDCLLIFVSLYPQTRSFHQYLFNEWLIIWSQMLLLSLLLSLFQRHFEFPRNLSFKNHHGECIMHDFIYVKLYKRQIYGGKQNWRDRGD